MGHTVTFLSNATGLELVRQPKHDVPSPNGVGWITMQDGVKYRFKPGLDEHGQLVGRLDVETGQDVLPSEMNGFLKPGVPNTGDRDAPTALRLHKNYGRDFWEMPTPTAEVRRMIRRFTTKLDADKLQELHDAEASTFNRGDMLAEIRDALELVQQEREELAAAQAEQESQAEVEGEAEVVAKPKAKAKPKAQE